MTIQYPHYLICKECGNRHDTEEVEFLNIEEDFNGRDIMTYTCPETKQETKSNIFRGY